MEKTGRRKFIIRSTAAGLGPTIIPRYVPGGRGYMPPSDHLIRGIVGVGGMNW